MSTLEATSFFELFQDDSREILQALQDLHKSKINFSISCFWDEEWDEGFIVKLGDEKNGYTASENFRTFRQCVVWLANVAIEKFPDSVFAEKYKE